MTTFTTEDKNEAYRKKVEEAPYHPGYEDAIITVEPIPFAGLVSIQDKEDTEQMLRHQLHIVTEQLNTVQAECQRLRNKLREAGIND
mgnify:CR=1 FL=1|jgi:septum formation inhibitor MinC|tara:strand:- start:1545 stop:1805 length:261 start_codon:yes stop_codon:yes gene_type:complete